MGRLGWIRRFGGVRVSLLMIRTPASASGSMPIPQTFPPPSADSYVYELYLMSGAATGK